MDRRVKQWIPAMEVTEGAGVTVYRTIGTPALKNLDPFLMLDHFSSNDPNDYMAGFPDHPHRGFITFTYMLDGHMEHRDSMGNHGDLRRGGAQWMKAASGVIHSEMPRQSDGLMRGFQLWINLPAAEKMTAPAYQEFSPAAIPVHESDNRRVRVLSGDYEGVQGPVTDPHTRVVYFDVQIKPMAQFRYPLAHALRGFVYVFEGDGMLAGSRLPKHSFALLDDGDQIEVTAGDGGVRFILVAGIPIGEPIVQYGPFVMTNQREIHQAFEDYRNGTLVREKAAFNVS